ncbi:MAG: rhodanese-like domain-containing protein [Candidatus Moranbacteria bacterium]|nr:rhodanese-like domain-containing protein [Candidatus Moranbacteria bacterium]
METEKDNKEKMIIGIGFGLILFVIVFTLLRNSDFTKKDTSDTKQSNLNSQLSTSLPYETIGAKDLNKKILGIGTKEEFTLLDIRPFNEYIQEHIVDAINIPLDEFPVKEKINTKNLIVLIGNDSADKNISTALEKLKEEDCKNIIVLAGGMSSWTQIIGATVTYGDPKSFVDQAKVSYLDPAELNDAITQKVPIYIIDVRSKEQYAEGHIAGAKNIPFEELEKRRDEITEKKVIVVGLNELQEFQASVQMYDMLLVSPYIMRTAMTGWKDKGFPLVK